MAIDVVHIKEYFPANGVENIDLSLQRFLKFNNFYDGKLDGKFGKQSYDAVASLLQSHKIDTKSWNKERLKTAAEQLFYVSRNIQVGKIDGFAGPLLKQARDTYYSQIVAKWRDEKDQLDAEVPPKPTPVKIKNVEVVKQWPRQSECMSFYGKPGTNQVDCVLPFPMVLEWNNKQKVKTYSCHKKVKEPMERIWQKVFDAYGYEKIRELRLDQWAGCLNVRQMRGGSSWSMHSWGIAVDIDSNNNQLRWGRDRATLSKPIYNKYWEAVYSEGAISLGKERNFDWMHWQFARF